MIIINAPLKREKIKELIENEIKNVKFISEVGMKMTYESTDSSDEENAKEIKSAIKSSDFGSALFFQISVE